MDTIRLPTDTNWSLFVSQTSLEGYEEVVFVKYLKEKGVDKDSLSIRDLSTHHFVSLKNIRDY